ncbi:MAG: CMP deaminase [Candidatus Wallbacteria bacterium HGW-Wallbacteria-1]|uniref:CMP deaminase n=1 Tax=Candidatus Wallbacteria bacterium HGW-Wallbacteria-1 TaxID=2013854 RepID=A0A2N1PK23_9BACT|nr:MAG: CMP deaminase [Candidatus Wallbacteria bacterium HGW-Wallbacteria-1]
MADWDKRFIELTRHISSWSKDRSIGTCAIIADDDHRIISTGFNGFPSGANDEIEDRFERPKKYLFTEHAERNAIYNAARVGISTRGCTMYLMWFPCADCARAIIQSGIKCLVCFPPDYSSEKWGLHFRAAREMLDECGVTIRFLDGDVSQFYKPGNSK